MFCDSLHTHLPGWTENAATNNAADQHAAAAAMSHIARTDKDEFQPSSNQDRWRLTPDAILL